MKKILALLIIIFSLFTAVWFFLIKKDQVNDVVVSREGLDPALPMSDVDNLNTNNTSNQDLEDISYQSNIDNNSITEKEDSYDTNSILNKDLENVSYQNGGVVYKESVFSGEINDLRVGNSSFTYIEPDATYSTFNPIDSDYSGVGTEKEDINLVVFDGNIPSAQDNEAYLRGIYDLITNTNSTNSTTSVSTDTEGSSLFVSSMAMDEIVETIKNSELYNSPIVKAHVYLYETTNEFLKDSTTIGGDSSSSGGASTGILGGAAAGLAGGISGATTDAATSVATSAVSMPFGGNITSTILCTCSANTLVYVQDKMTMSVLPLVYQPGVTMLYSNYNVFTPGVSLVGTYTPGAGICLVYSGSHCNPIPAIGMMNALPGVGTSLSPTS